MSKHDGADDIDWLREGVLGVRERVLERYPRTSWRTCCEACRVAGRGLTQYEQYRVVQVGLQHIGERPSSAYRAVRVGVWADQIKTWDGICPANLDRSLFANHQRVVGNLERKRWRRRGRSRGLGADLC